MASSKIPVPTAQPDIDALLMFGLLVESMTYPDVPMNSAISRLASPDSPFNLTQMLAGVVSDPDAKVAVLNTLIPTLPKDVTSAGYIAGYYVVTSISVAAVCLRLYARHKYTGRIRLEDWWAIVAALFAIVIAILFTLCLTTARAGHHLWAVSFNDFTLWLKFLTAGEMFFSVCLVPVKIVFLIFYHSLSPNRTYRFFLVVVSVFVVLLTIAGLILMFLQCQPFDIWNHVFTAKCIDQVKAFTIWGILTIISDFAILLLPISEVLKLNLRRKEKMMIVGIFSTGAVVCIASILRVMTLNDVFKSTDRIYVVTAVSIWSLVELNLALICSCLPALKHLFIGVNRHNFEFRSPLSFPSYVVRSIKWGNQCPRRKQDFDTLDFSTNLSRTDYSGQTALGTVTTCLAGLSVARTDEQSGKKEVQVEIRVGQKILETQHTIMNAYKDGHCDEEIARAVSDTKTKRDGLIP